MRPMHATNLVTFLTVVTTLMGATSSMDAAEDLRSGLPWAQFHSPDFTRPAGKGCDKQINLDTGTTIDGYARFWTGLIEAPATGEVTFSAEADDGVQLRIDGKSVINGWGLGLPREGKLSMKKGRRLPIKVYYYQSGGTGYIRLSWSWEGKERELIPASAFRYAPEHARCIDELMQGKRKVDVQAPCPFPIKSRIYQASKPSGPRGPIRLKPGPHLLIDDYLIAESENVERKVNAPRRDLSGPVVTGKGGKGDDCFQPYMEIIRDPKTGRFRIWYGVPEDASQSHVGYMESDDGIHWQRPHRVLEDPSPIQFGVSVIDEGPNFAKPEQRFKCGYYGKERPGGLRIAVSPDGLSWRALVDRVVLHHRHDINNVYRVVLRDRYMAIISTYIPGPTWSGHRRVTLTSYSQDLVQWARPWLIVTPNDKIEPGETQFYAMCGFLTRGDLLIGMVKVLHDDFSADPDGPKAGVGWTSLAWTRDGEHWTRDLVVFFDRHPEKGQWDHAMAWIDCQVPVDDQVYLYYGGYKQGHKINRFEERQIGLVRMRRDRYVARQAGAKVGLLRTPPLVLEGSTLTLNVDASEGEVRVQVEDGGGKPVDGLSFDDVEPVHADSLHAPVEWKSGVRLPQSKPIRLAIRLRQARLFALGVR